MLLLYLWLLVPYKLKKGTSYADYMDEKKIKKVCFECKLSRPYRGYHCDICNQCISQYDHHCTWISNCVGKHNIARFICFLFFLLVSLAFIGLVAVLALIEIAIDNHDLYLELLMFRYDLNTTVDVACTAGLLAVDMICSLFVFPVLLLFVVQVKNLLRNKTTYEAMSGKEDTQSAREKLRKHKNQVSLRNCKVMCSNHRSFATTTSSNENTDELITDKFPSEQK